MKNVIGFTLLFASIGLSCYGLHQGAVRDIADEDVRGDWR